MMPPRSDSPLHYTLGQVDVLEPYEMDMLIHRLIFKLDSPPPMYSSNIQEAYKVIEFTASNLSWEWHLNKDAPPTEFARILTYKENNMYACCYYMRNIYYKEMASEDTVSLAHSICRVALRANRRS